MLAIALLAFGALPVGAVGQPVNLDSEEVLLDTLAGRLEQAAQLSKAFLAEGSDKHLRALAQTELRLRRLQATQLRERLRRWYGIESARNYPAPSAKEPDRYAEALRINHGQIIELLELSQGLRLRAELRRYMDQIALDCLVQLPARRTASRAQKVAS
ncbi:hypothetical protein GCM10007907_30590 [Chitinimonas prasina]|uniref:DUF4142 domain-containing protein n=1 Tax=Chitinimonas prasina TaxID=1434937 RepID=A0ABQ5YJZ7_9NEIS|nr:hypothetical protein GCM10007907_30590 [Chitinimonas prasina]